MNVLKKPQWSPYVTGELVGVVSWFSVFTTVKNKLIKLIMIMVWVTVFIWVGQGRFLFASDDKNIKGEAAIRIDIPVVLKKVNVVFNMDHLAFDGDMPVGIKYMHLLANRFKELGTEGRIIGIFHADAAYMSLNDKAYNAYRKVSFGNPYKGLIAMLMKQGVQIEECAVSMKARGWSNEDLLPGVKVNTGAVGRIIQLVQDGYIQIQP